MKRYVVLVLAMIMSCSIALAEEEQPKSVWDSIYDDLRFVRHMMDKFALEDDDATARTAIQPYIGKDTKDLEIPDYKWDDDEDEEDDEDYEDEEDDEDDESDEDE